MLSHLTYTEFFFTDIKMSANRGSGIPARKAKVQSRTYELEIVENARGKIIKISEIYPDDRMNQIFMTVPTAREFVKSLESMIVFNHALKSDCNFKGHLRTEFINKDEKQYSVVLRVSFVIIVT